MDNNNTNETTNIDEKKEKLNMIFITGFAFFPHVEAEVNLTNPTDINSCELAYKNNEDIITVYTYETDDNKQILCKFACKCHINRYLKIGETAKVSLVGVSRVMIKQEFINKDYTNAEIMPLIIKNNMMSFKDNAPMVKECISILKKVLSANIDLINLAEQDLENSGDVEKFVNVVSPAIIGQGKSMFFMLTETDVNIRLSKLLEALKIATNTKEMRNDISQKVNQKIMKSQKEMYLREELNVINKELYGDEDESEALRQKVKSRKMPAEIEEYVLKEILRMQKLMSGSPELGYIRNYVETMIDLPWTEKSDDKIELNEAKAHLDKQHYGLKDVKERILEYLAVLKKMGKYSGQILCFVGPPGTGKTSIAKSIAEALNRNFVQVSLGGVNDESVIRGHRRTYLGAMPGRIIAGMKQAKSTNPVFLLDEIDKMTSDIKGDPSAALLEVLDPEQNYRFKDNYIETEYNLGDVLFIATANDKNKIPYALYDRMEIVELNTYTDDEKYNIALKHLLPKLMERSGLTEKDIKFSDEAIVKIINDYTMEAGVRNLERNLAKICRKVVFNIESNQSNSVTINENDLQQYLGAGHSSEKEMYIGGNVGEVVGLAWTAYGGTLTLNEIALSEGKGEVKFTGKLGNVYKEVVSLVHSIIKSIAPKYNIDKEKLSKTDIHFHLPEMAIGKEGPSGGVALVIAMLSALTNTPVKEHLGMTGEVSLRGRVLPIGGLKEKCLAAIRYNIKEVIVPLANKGDIEDIKDLIDGKLTVHFAHDIYEAIKFALNLTPKTDEEIAHEQELLKAKRDSEEKNEASKLASTQIPDSASTETSKIVAKNN